MLRKPRIAVILDENTSGDASRYEASKGYFRAIANAGGLPFGIPYHSDLIDVVVEEFEGLLCVGGRFAYPDYWYLPGQSSKAPPSERLAVEARYSRRLFAARQTRSRDMCGHAAARLPPWLPTLP